MNRSWSLRRLSMNELMGSCFDSWGLIISCTVVAMWLICLAVVLLSYMLAWKFGVVSLLRSLVRSLVVGMRRRSKDVEESSTAPRYVWRNKYPSVEEMHALLDRGDVLMAGIFIATTLQLSHPRIGKVLKAHSTYESDFWRRLVRTLAFIRISMSSNSWERSQVVSWLHKLHAPIPLFGFDANVFILATITYGIASAHKVLGCVMQSELDALASVIMTMANQLESKPHTRSLPTTLREVERYLAQTVDLDSTDMFTTQIREIQEVYKSQLPQFRWSSSSFVVPVMVRLWTEITLTVLVPNKLSGNGFLLKTIKALNPLWSHFHFSACPRLLTFDGLLEMLFSYRPSLKNVMYGVYEEIFGEKSAATLYSLALAATLSCPQGLTTQLFVPQLDYADSPETVPLGATVAAAPSRLLYLDILEYLKCASLRARLARLANAGQLPYHLGVIMDGNRRFARQHQLRSVTEGHRCGANKLLEFITWCFSAGVTTLTVWALSDDNMKRGNDELDPLFLMMSKYIEEIVLGRTPITILGVRVRVVGDKSLLPESLNATIEAVENATKDNCTFNLQLAMGYGGRAETTRALRKAVQARAKESLISVEEALLNITLDDVSKHTYSAELGLPEIDAIFRTSGEMRLSGFALWESQKAEISVTSQTWPSLTQSTFLQSLIDLSQRNRRFGS